MACGSPGRSCVGIRLDIPLRTSNRLKSTHLTFRFLFVYPCYMVGLCVQRHQLPTRSVEIFCPSMLRRQSYKFEGRPNGEQLRHLRRFAGACRFVYNKALALNKERNEKKEKRLGYASLCAQLPKWKTEFAWLSDVPAQAFQQSLKDLERGFTNFFEKRAEFPEFHSRSCTAELPTSERILCTSHRTT